MIKKLLVILLFLNTAIIANCLNAEGATIGDPLNCGTSNIGSNNDWNVTWDYNVNLTGNITQVNILTWINWFTVANYDLTINGVNHGNPTNKGTACSGTRRWLQWNFNQVLTCTNVTFQFRVCGDGWNGAIGASNLDLDGDGDTSLTVNEGSCINPVNTKYELDMLYWFEFSGVRCDTNISADLYNESVSFRFIDAMNGNILKWYNPDFTHSTYTNDYIEADIYSSITIGGQTYISKLLTNQKNGNVVTGTLYISDYSDHLIQVYSSGLDKILGYRNGVPSVWLKYNETRMLVGGNTYELWIMPVSGGSYAADLPNCDNYKSTFGDFFIEFFNYDVQGEYKVGSQPYIAYNLSDADSNGVGSYGYGIYDNYGNYVYRSWVDTNVNCGYMATTGFKFSKPGTYHIRLYNLSTDDLSFDTLLYTSRSIQVGDDTGKTGVGDIDLSNIPLLYKLLATLFITMGLTLSPLAMAMYLSKAGMKVQIPELVYVAFFFLGICISIAFGFIGIEVLFIILFGLIITLSILWLQRNGIAGGE